MERVITGSVSPRAALHPVGFPPTSCSKRGASMAGIPSLRGPPDLISRSGTLYLEKSVRGHSSRQLAGSASDVPRLASSDTPMSVVSASSPGRLHRVDAMAVTRNHSVDQNLPQGQFGLIASAVSLSSAWVI